MAEPIQHEVLLPVTGVQRCIRCGFKVCDDRKGFLAGEPIPAFEPGPVVQDGEVMRVLSPGEDVQVCQRGKA